MLKMTIDNEEVVSDKDITINEEMLSASSTILNNVYPKEWEEDKDYTSRFYYPQDYSKALIQRSYVTQEAEVGTTIQVNGSVTLTDVDTTKNSRVLRLLGQTSQTGTPTPSSPIPVNVVSGDNEIQIYRKNRFTFNNLTDNTQIGVTVTYNNSELKLNGTSSSAGSIINDGTSLGITLPIGSYMFSIKEASGSFTKTSTQDIALFLKDANNNNIANTSLGAIDYPSSKTFTKQFTLTQATDLYFYIYCSASGIVFNNLVFQIQIEDGSTKTTFEPYQGNTYNIDLPIENKFDISTITESKYINSSGNLSNTSNSNTSDYISVSINESYTLSWDYTLPLNSTSRREIVLYNTSKTFVETITLFNIDSATKNITFTPSQSGYIRFDYDKKCFDIQLEKGSKQNNFTPYGTTPIELCNIPNTIYQDGIFKTVNGDTYYDSLTQAQKDLLTYDKWYLHKEIGKIATYNGETITTDYISTTGQLTTGATIYYGLSTPTNTEITYQPLIEQLNVLSSQ